MTSKYPPSCIPNDTGTKIIAHLSSGQSIEAEVFRDESCCHCLRVPIAQVSSWNHVPTAEGAIAVLHHVDKIHDANIGINWDSIEASIQALYG